MNSKSSLIAAMVFAGAVAAYAAEPVGGKMKAHGASPCCAVTAIDAARSVATLKNLKTGETFQVRVQNKAKLKSLKVGQQVDRNL